MNNTFLAGPRKTSKLSSTASEWVAQEAARMRSSDGFNPFPVTITATMVAVAAVLMTSAAVGATALAGRAVMLATVVVFGAWAAWIDSRSHRIPDAVTIPMAAAVIATLISSTALSADWVQAGQAALGAAALGGLYAAAAIFGDLGLGDVKLAAILGLSLAYTGWTALLWGGILGLVLALPHALWIRGKARRIPLGPYMVAGAIAALIPNILNILWR